MKKELPEPPDCHSASQAVELMSGWLIEGKLQCVVFPIWKDQPENWGTLLADTVSHICDAMSAKSGNTTDEIKGTIVNAFLKELDHPTDATEGEFFT